MRIAWVIYGALEQMTGGYLYDCEIVRGLRAIGHDVLVWSLPEAAKTEAVRALVEVVQAGRFDVCVGDELCFRELGPAFEALAGGPVRVLLVHHLARWEGCGKRDHEAEERALAAADTVVITSTASARRLADEGCAAPIAVVEPGADRLARFGRVRSADAQGGELLFVGNLMPRKDVLALLAAFERGAAPGARLALAGDGSRDPAYAASVRATVARSPRLAAVVELLGPLSDAALADAFARASVLVLPSSLEGYGMVLTEAVAAGTPVICTTTCPAGVALAEAGAALAIPQGDTAALAEALAAFTSDASLRARMTAAAAALAPTLPRWSDAVTAFHAALTTR